MGIFVCKRFPRKKIKITLTIIVPKFEKYSIKRLKSAEIYQNSSNHTYYQPKKSKKWPVIRSDLREKIDFGLAWVWGGVIVPNISLKFNGLKIN